VFDTETIEKIISNELREKALEILPISGRGFVNRVFRVETKIAKHIVRLNSANSYDEYQKEVWATNQALEKNIPTPKILKIGVFDNQAFSIQEFINGIEGRDFSADTKFIWKKLGEYAQQIHSIKVGGFGLDFTGMTASDSQKIWLRYLNYNIESLDENDKLLTLNVLTKAQSKIVRSIFEKLKLRKFNFGLNHGDLSLKNTIIDEFKTVHLIDWGSAEASIVPHHDLIELLKENMQENNPTDSEIEVFLEGYGISKNEFQKMLPDLKSLLLLRAFDKLRWAIDWKISELEDYVQHAKETVDNVLN
jgi:aminoglycoside phosphotransferase (APT) family kinase protein/uncharacterized protein Usg